MLREYRIDAEGFPDILPYDCMPANGVVQLIDGTLLAAWRYTGPDASSKSHEEMDALSAQVSRVLCLGSGWMWQFNAIRSAAPGYPEGGFFPDPVTRMIDEERRAHFMDKKAHYESEYYVCLSYQPPPALDDALGGFLYDAPNRGDGAASRALAYFEGQVGRVEKLLGYHMSMHRLRTLNSGRDELLSFIRWTFSGEYCSLMLPDVPSCLMDVIGCLPFVAGFEPVIGDMHIRVVAIDGYPLRSYSAMLEQLDQMEMSYRWATRALMMDNREARGRMEKIQQKWKSTKHGFLTKILKKEAETPPKEYPEKMEKDAGKAMSEADEAVFQYAYFDHQLILMDKDADVADRCAELAMKVVFNNGFSCRLEKINAVEAFLGSLPGDGHSNVRRSQMHSLNIADMLPLAGVWTGWKHNPSSLMPQDSDPLFMASTAGATPYRFHQHVDDVGHELTVGPPGSGKSTYYAFKAAQWFRFPDARVIAFDKGHSLYALTQACGGHFYDVGSEDVQFCPLATLATDSDMAWAMEWLETLCNLQGLDLTPDMRHSLAVALGLVRKSPFHRLTDLCLNVQDAHIRMALEPYLHGSAIGNMLDADADSTVDGRFITYEVGALMGMGERAVAAVLLYLFRRIERSAEHGNGGPTLALLDEAWVMLKHERFRERIREWLKTFRKYNVAVSMATQNLSDIFNSPIRDVILENCPTKVLLANPQAMNPVSRDLYKLIGLNDVEIEGMQMAVPKRDYYCLTDDRHRRMFTLELGPTALAYCGVSSRQDKLLIDECIRQHGEVWPMRWLEQRTGVAA